MVMGQAEMFPKWYGHLSNINTSNVQVTFLYASYDNPVGHNESHHQCHHQEHARPATNDFVDCQLRFIPNTTWTQGRNFLARESLALERKRGRNFDFWTFSDDDVYLHCGIIDDNKHDMQEEHQCWQQFLEFHGQVRVLSIKEITTVTFALRKSKSEGWFGETTHDAVVASFQREYVPFLLPYVILPVGFSEWISQAALFCIMQTCFQSSIVTPSHVYIENRLHRDYQRKNFNLDMIMHTIRRNFGSFLNVEHCSNMTFLQGDGRIGPFDSIQELIASIPSHNQSFCAPLIQRFDDWEQITQDNF
jgi:hypothetical protein